MRSRESRTQSSEKMHNDSQVDTSHQVVSQELHDEGGVLVALLAKCIEFYRNTSDTRHSNCWFFSSHQQWHRQRLA